MIAGALSLALMLAGACGPAAPIYQAESGRVSNPRYGGPSGYPRAVEAGTDEECPESSDTVTVTNTESVAETGTAEETESAAAAPCRVFSADREYQELVALAQPRAGDPRGGPTVTETRNGRASYYSDSLAGRPTSSGERYDPTLFTAASRDLPFDTLVRVTRIGTGQVVIVRINDRGPFGDERRILDLSRAAAERIDMIHAGVVEIRAEVLGTPED